MGKVLVIKNADFSRNCLKQIDIVDDNDEVRYFGIEFVRESPNGGGETGYYKLIGEQTEISLFDEITPCLVKDAKVYKNINPTNWNKYSDGTDSDLSGTNDTDVMLKHPRMYAILGGSDEIYERWIFSKYPFEYKNDVAKLIEPFAECPDYENIVSGKARSIVGAVGSITATRATNIQGGLYSSNIGYPTAATNGVTRETYEAAARAHNTNTLTNIPYAPGNTIDMLLLIGMMYVECRTKNINSIFGHGISCNVKPNASNWGKVSGFRTTNGSNYFDIGNDGVYINGTKTPLWTILNGRHSYLKVMQVQQEISNDNSMLDSVSNADGVKMKGVDNGVMTGVFTKSFTFDVNCSLNSSESDSLHSFECVLKVPVYRGRTHLYGNIWSDLSGSDVLNDATHNNSLYEAQNIEDIATDGNNGTSYLTKYKYVGDLGKTSGWATKSLNSDGQNSVWAVGTTGSISTYECVYNYLSSATGKYSGSFFGGDAYYSTDVLRYCSAVVAPSYTSTRFGSRFRVKLIS